VTSSPGAPSPLAIDAIAGNLQQAYKGGHVLVSAATTGAGEVADLLAAVGLTEMSIATSTPPTVDQGRVVLAGRSSALGSDADTTVVLEVIDGVVAASLSSALPGETLSLVNLGWATVTDLGVAVQVVGSPSLLPLVDRSLHGAVRLAGTPDPIQVTVGSSPRGGWELRARDIPLPDPVALLSTLLEQPDGTSPLPPSLAGAPTQAEPTASPGPVLAIRDLTCDVDPDDLSVQALSVTVGTGPTDVWAFAPGLPGLRDVSLGFALAFPGSDDPDTPTDGTPTLTVFGGAHIVLGELDLPVRILGSAQEWRVGILGAHGFPSVGELISHIGGHAFATSLPPSLATLQMESATVDVALDGQDGSLRAVLVQVALDTWTLVPGHCSLEHVAAEVRLDGPSGAMSGFVTGTVVVDGVRVGVAVRKASPSEPLALTLAVGEPPTVSGLSKLSGFAGGHDAGDHLPDGCGDGPVVLRDLTVTFDPESYEPSQLRLDVQADGPWALPEIPGFALEDVHVDLTAMVTGDPDVVGSLGFVVGVGASAVCFAATRTPDVAWRFEGHLEGPPVDLAALLTPFVDGSGGHHTPASLVGATLSRADVTFDAGGAVHLDCSGSLAIDGSKLDLDLSLDVDQAPGGGRRVVVAGEVWVAGLDFRLAVADDSAESRAVALYTHDTTVPSIKASELLREMAPDLAAALFPDPEHHDLEIDVRSAILALATGGPTGTRALVAIDIGRIELSELPLVGPLLADAASVEDLRVIAATAAPQAPAAAGAAGQGAAGQGAAGQGPADPGDLAAWNALLTGRSTVSLPSAGIDSGVSVVAVLDVAGSRTPLDLAAGGTPGATPPTGVSPASPGGAAAAPARPTDSTTWIAVERSFGPVHIARVGARLDSGVLWVAVDASLSLGGLSFSLMGLSVGSTLTSFDPHVHLDGLGLSFHQDPLEIAGAFLAVPAAQLGEASFQYDGAAVVRAETFTLSAVGSYAEIGGAPSLFVFAELDAPLGGPAAFYVTGLMGGFGYNRALRIPEQDEILGFPFVAGLGSGAGTATGVGDGTPLGVLEVLDGRGESAGKAWLTLAPGESWLALGVTFTSFEMVHTRALLIAEFGLDLQFALVGLSTLRLPTEGTEQFAYVELQVEAVLKPQAGFFGVTAQLSPNSFVLAPECRLTGGFAFYVWFGRDHYGDFVLTLGGYHPAFERPDHYPLEPRVGFHWPVSDLVTIEGEAYFALTPSCVMAGGALRVLFHSGGLRAWLVATADFLIGWKPFCYEVDLHVSIGVSYRLDLGFLQKTLSVELGAQLHLEGPPTYGSAHISWWVLSFTIPIGAPPKLQDEVRDWTYVAGLLPDADLCRVTVQAGLLPGRDTSQGHKGDDGPWLVRADGLRLATECAVPASRLVLGAHPHDDVATPQHPPALRPLGLHALTSTHTLHVTGPTGKPVDLVHDGWTVQPRRRNLPEALWGAPLTGTPPPSAALVEDQLVGFLLEPPASKEGPACGPVDMATHLPTTPVESTVDAPRVPARVHGVSSPQALQVLAGTIATTARSAREAVRAELAGLDLETGSPAPLDDFAALVREGLLPDPPLLAEEAR
jgi:hypothetical protein